MLNQVIDWLFAATRSPSINWKLVLIGGALFDLGFKTLLDIRQYKVQSRPSPPQEVVKEGLVDDETFKKSQSYNRTTLTFGIVNRVYDFLLNVLLIKYDVLPTIWHFTKHVVATKFWGGEKTVGALAMLAFSAVSTIAGLPFGYYSTFVIEEKFGFNKSTVALWIKDTLKSWVLAIALLPPLLGAIQAIIEYFGNMFIPYLLLFLLMLSLTMTVVYPVLLDPWFNKYTPLEAGDLRTAIERLASSLEFPLGRIYVVDGSTRSSHSNAYFIGFPWYKQIVLFDTLIKDQTTDQIVAVLAHELGHWKRNHMTILLSMGMFTSFFNFLPLALFLGNGHFFESLGFGRGETPIAVALAVYMDALAPLSALLTFGQNFVVRCCEYDADRFAVRRHKGASLRKALVTLTKSNLSVVDADKLYSTFHNSHPIIPERLRAIDAEIKKLA